MSKGRLAGKGGHGVGDDLGAAERRQRGEKAWKSDDGGFLGLGLDCHGGVEEGHLVWGGLLESSACTQVRYVSVRRPHGSPSARLEKHVACLSCRALLYKGVLASQTLLSR